MVNQAFERMKGCFFDGEEPNRGFMKSMCLLSNADRLKASDTCRLGALELLIVDVEELSAFVIASF
jgi:hypothetical protein